MKILNVNIAINSRTGGGTAERTFNMSMHLSKNEVECSILTLDLGLTEGLLQSLKDSSVDVVALPSINDRFFIPSFSRNSLKRVYAAIAKADIIHLMGHWSVINAIAFFFIRQLNKPYVFCPAGALIVHGRSKIFKRIYNILIGNSMIRNANQVIASTHDEVYKIEKYNVPLKRISVIQNGVNESSILKGHVDFREKFNLGDCPYILFLGSFSSIKGPDLLIRAFHRVKQKFPRYHLVFGGTDRGTISDILDYIDKFHLKDQTHFVGYLNDLYKSNAYHDADLLVVPSRSEVISMVALEAGITGTPVLLTDKCGFNEIASIDGGMVVPTTIDGLEKGLVELLSAPDQLERRGGNLKKHIMENYTWDIIIKKYIELYEQIIKLKLN